MNWFRWIDNCGHFIASSSSIVSFESRYAVSLNTKSIHHLKANNCNALKENYCVIYRDSSSSITVRCAKRNDKNFLVLSAITSVHWNHVHSDSTLSFMVLLWLVCFDMKYAHDPTTTFQSLWTSKYVLFEIADVFMSPIF